MVAEWGCIPGKSATVITFLRYLADTLQYLISTREEKRLTRVVFILYLQKYQVPEANGTSKVRSLDMTGRKTLKNKITEARAII